MALSNNVCPVNFFHGVRVPGNVPFLSLLAHARPKLVVQPCNCAETAQKHLGEKHLRKIYMEKIFAGTVFEHETSLKNNCRIAKTNNQEASNR